MEATIKLLRPFSQQRDILHHPARFKVLAIGRQWGKSELAIMDGVDRLLKGQHIWYCSPTNKNNKRLYPKFKSVFRGFPGLYTNDSDMLIRLPNGGVIQFLSLEVPDNLRGEGLDHIYIDEAAFIRPGVWDKVLRPMLAVRRGSAWFMSSPNGNNEFWQWVQYGKDPEYSEWHSWHFSSATSPVLDIHELESIRLNTPQRAWRQEFEAEFLEDGGAVFRNIAGCIDPDLVIDRENGIYPRPMGVVVMGADLGRHEDYTVIYAIDTGTRRVVDYDRFTDISWDIQAVRITAMARRWNPKTIWMEENFNDSFVERLQGEGLPVSAYRTTAQSKQQIINQLALAFEQRDIRIPDEPVLLGELQAYSIERLPSGTIRYAAPSGMHDDCVMALALSWHGVTAGVATITVTRYV